MFNKKMIGIGVAVLVMVLAGVALAAAVKVTLTPYPASEPIEPNAKGKVILNYAKGAAKTEIQVSCTGLTSDTQYTVYLKDPITAAFYSIGTFTTDEFGSGAVHVKLSGDKSRNVPVAVNNTAANLTVLLGP